MINMVLAVDGHDKLINFLLVVYIVVLITLLRSLFSFFLKLNNSFLLQTIQGLFELKRNRK